MKTSLISTLLGVATICTVSAFAQSYNFTTLAGTAFAKGSTDGTGSVARFNSPYGVVPDGQGNVYVADTYNYTIRKVTSKGVVTTIAGMAGSSGFTDGVGSTARFYFPAGMALDAQGVLYLTDASTVRKVTQDGTVTTIAGMLGVAAYQDGIGTNAGFHGLQGLALDSAGNLYVADNGNYRIRKITTNAVVTTIAGPTGLISPRDVAINSTGIIYVADGTGNVIQKVMPDGTVSIFAGKANTYGSQDGVGSAARFSDPQGLAIDSVGNLYVVDNDGSRIRQITPDGTVTTIGGASNGYADGVGTAARFNAPHGINVDKWGNIFIPDDGNQVIRKGTPILPIQIYPAGAQLAIAWPLWATNYVFESRGTLTNSWTSITNNISTNAANLIYTSPADPAQYFRLRTP